MLLKLASLREAAAAAAVKAGFQSAARPWTTTWLQFIWRKRLRRRCSFLSVIGVWKTVYQPLFHAHLGSGSVSAAFSRGQWHLDAKPGAYLAEEDETPLSAWTLLADTFCSTCCNPTLCSDRPVKSSPVNEPLYGKLSLLYLTLLLSVSYLLQSSCCIIPFCMVSDRLPTTVCEFRSNSPFAPFTETSCLFLLSDSL